MTIRLAAPLALLALSFAGSAGAAAPDAHAGHTAQPTEEAEAKPAKPRRVCRREAATGSVMPKLRNHLNETAHDIDARDSIEQPTHNDFSRKTDFSTPKSSRSIRMLSKKPSGQASVISS